MVAYNSVWSVIVRQVCMCEVLPFGGENLFSLYGSYRVLIYIPESSEFSPVLCHWCSCRWRSATTSPPLAFLPAHNLEVLLHSNRRWLVMSTPLRGLCCYIIVCYRSNGLAFEEISYSIYDEPSRATGLARSWFDSFPCERLVARLIAISDFTSLLFKWIFLMNIL